ncbi:MAG: hypothetical protein HY976_00495, partial [Candidatus Kerfeldbacteria bacterium]|nr:hypothetical protein [Candidatus Kerfeldbacteria bacterium]
IVAADDVTIRRNTLGFAVLGQEGTSAERITFTDNIVRSTANKLVAIRGSGLTPCPASQHVISNNTFISDHVCTPGVDCDEPMILFVWCVSHSTFSHNTMTAASKSQGIRLRDESDNNSFTNNTVWVHDPDGSFGALNITSGNAGKHHPRLNTFSNNLFRSDTDLALNMQSPGDGNAFDHNVFWSNTDGIANMMNDGSNNNSWDHNTFFNAGSAPALLFDYRNNRPTDNFTNNIIATSGATAVQVTSGVGWDFSRYAGNYNLFWSTNAAATFLPYGTLASWNNSGSPDDDNSLYGNPHFTNAAAGLFTIQSISPALSAGSNGSNIGALGVDTGPVNCSESWSCGEWSACLNGIQTRTCLDANICGTTASRPAITQSCAEPIGPDATSPNPIANLLAS